MKKSRIIIIALSVVLFSGLIVYAVQTQTRKPAPKPAAGQKKTAPTKKAATSANVVARQADPNRAPQKAVDEALFTDQTFFGTAVSLPRPYSEAADKVDSLITQYPKDSALRLHAARLDERIGRFDQSASQMEEFVKIKNSSEDALRRQAAFFHKRARYVDEVRTLQKLAKASATSDREAIYKRAVSLVEDHKLTEFTPDEFYTEMLADDPNSVEVVKKYIQSLMAARRYPKALEIINTYETKFVDQQRYFLKTRAEAYEAQNNRTAALTTYSQRFSPTWSRGIASDYYELLRKYGKYRDYRRNLQTKIRQSPTDFDSVSRLFNVYAYESNIPYAAHVLAQFEQKKTGGGNIQGMSLTPQELSSVADMYATIGYFDQASRYLYTLYLTGTLSQQSQTREEALYHLFKALIDGADMPTRVGAGDLKFYQDVATVDRNPGLLNGVLSLILSGTDPGTEFKSEEKKAAAYFNCAFAFRLFSSFKTEFVASKRLPQMYLDMIDAFAGYGQYQLAVNMGKEFQTKYPKAREFADVGLKIADSQVSLKQRAAERTTLQGILDFLASNRPAGARLLAVSSKRWRYTPTANEGVGFLGDEYERESAEIFDPADSESRGSDYHESEYDYRGQEINAAHSVTYSQVLERMIASYTASEKQADALKFFWAEIKKHPKEEGLYERFLKWLEQTSLIDEQLKAYTAAINQYNSQTWYDRMARFYIKQKKQAAFVAYTKQLLDVFDDDEASVYMQDFGHTSIEGDRTLTFNLYRMAHDRFPHNLDFVRGLLSYYVAEKNWTEWEKLSDKYYFSDTGIRNNLLARYAETGTLRTKFAEAEKNRDQLAYREFHADAAMWLSHFDQALDTYRELAKLYPGETAYVQRLADLTRSLGHADDKLYAESSQAWASMAEIYPTAREYRTKAGETLAEMGDFAGAKAEWDKLLAKEQGNSPVFLEVASIYWDYYQWNDAIRTINDLRRVSGNQTAYAYQMGALYEGKTEWDKAITEYVATLGDADQGKSIERLGQLAPRRNFREVIARAFEQRRNSQPENSGLILAYAEFLQNSNRSQEAFTLLRGEVAKRNSIDFLESVRDVFHANQLTADEQLVIAKLIDSARDVREQLQYRLQMAAFYEANNKSADAAQAFDRIVADYPTNLGVLQESTSFYWRAGLIDKSIGLYREAIGRAQGQYKHDFTMTLADRQTSANKLADAEATLRILYSQDPMDTDAFGKLVKVLGDQNKNDALIELYKEALDTVAKSNLDRDTATQRLREIRLGMVLTMARLRRPSEAVDQYIEIINRQPEDADLLNNAVAFAERNNQLDRLVKYYQDTSQKSFKDYRWNIVLARISEHKGDYASSIPQYQNAVQNEPQRLDFRSTLADAFIRTGKFDEAIAELRRGRELDSGNNDWLVRIALVQVQQGKRADAVATLRTAMNSSKNSLASSVFVYADKLRQWGLSKEALEFYDEGLRRYLKNPYEQNLTPETLNSLIEVSLKNESPVKTAQRLESLIATLQTEQSKQTNYEKYKIDAALRQTYSAIEGTFAKDVAAFGNTDELKPLADFYKRGIAQTNGYDENAQKQLRHFAAFGHGALLTDVEEGALLKLKDSAYVVYKAEAEKARAAANGQPAPPNNQPTRNSRTGQALNRGANETIGSAVDSQHYYNELINLLNFYDSRAVFDRSAQLLEASYQQDPIKDKFEYFTEIAWRYEMSGQLDREQASLKQYFDSRAGDLSASDDPAIGRYLELVYSMGHPQNLAISDGTTQPTSTARPAPNPAAEATLREIASRYNPHQLQVINFFIDHGEEALAQEAITHTNLSASWVASRSAQVALYFKDQSSKSEGFFKVALDIRNIGDTLKAKPVADGLSQHDWLWTARSYGMWLNLTPARANESRRYIAGLIERRPRDLEAQLQLAQYYVDAEQTKRATEHAAIAEELSPNNPRILAVRGSILFADGKVNDAIATWSTIATRKGAGQNDLELYFSLMRDHKLARQALPQLEAYLIAHVTKSDELEALKPFIREIAYSAYSDESEKVYRVAQSIGTPQPLSNTLDTQTATAITVMFRNVTQKLPDNLLFPEMILNEHLISDSDRAEFYRIVIAREENKVLALLSSGEDPDKFSEYRGGDYSRPLDSLDQWREQYLNYLIDHKSYAQAHTELEHIRTSEAAMKKDNYKPTDDNVDSTLLGGKDWSVIVEARLNIREGKSAEALTALRRFAGVGTATTDSGLVAAPARDNAIAAATMLRREGKSDLADQLMRDTYSQIIAAGQMDAANFAGLAELEFKTGGSERALALLKRMVDAHIGDEVTVKLAAATAARYQSYTAALAYRQKAQTLNPEDAENRLETARILAALNRKSEAADLITAVAEDRTSSNTAKAASAFLMAEVAKGDQATMTRLVDTYKQKAAGGSVYAKLILAQLLDASGQAGPAEQTLQTASNQQYSGIANLMLGGFESKHGNVAAAAKAFETYLYQDPDGLISDAVVFGVARPREQLISLYATHGLESAAIQIANRSGEYQRSTQQGDDEGAVFYSQQSESSVLSSQPGGWFMEIYLYPLYSVPSSNLFKIPPGHGPVSTVQAVTEIEDTTTKFRTIAELNLEALLQGRRAVLRQLSQVAARAGDFPAAVEYERARRPLLVTTQSINESTIYLINLIGKQRDAEKRLIAKSHVDRAFTDEPANSGQEQ